MKLTPEIIKQLEEDLAQAKTYNDLMGKNGAIKKLIKSSLENILETELSEHLGYEKHSPEGNNSGNSRNGKTHKSVKTDEGMIDLEIPRDRNSSFDPVIVKKYEKTLGPIEDKIISMYAKGMTTRDIQSHVEEMYGLEVTAATVSRITDSIVVHAKEWQSRPLSEIYPIVFFDAIHYKVRQEGKVVSKAAYTCLAIDIEGQKDMLGIWIGESEGANYWLGIMTELKNRGVQDILIAAVDGLKGFPEAIESVFPGCEVQQCVIHQIRNTIRYIASKNQKEFMKDLKPVYQAPTEEAGLLALDKLEEKWGDKYPFPIKSWRNNWNNLAVFFNYPPEIRKMIYTTNAVENLHRQFRKVTKNRSIFPSDDALTKMIFLAYRDISKKWKMTLPNWGLIISQLSIRFEKRIMKFL
ncbi:MAG: IS256 family transposase [Melioribacteraceae bacterium]|nr:IS256 family transposase [Melioribacteraceae bacterium]